MAFEHIGNSFKQCQEHLGKLFGVILVYGLFFWVMGFVKLPLSSGTAQALTKSLGLLEGQFTVLEFLGHPYTANLIGWMLMMFVVYYVLFVIFVGHAAYVVHSICGKHATHSVYLQHFARAAVPWGFVYLVMQTIALVIDYMYVHSTVPSSFFFVYDVLLMLLLYGAFLHFSLIGNRPVTFRRAVKEFGTRFNDLFLLMVLLYMLSKILDWILAMFVGTTFTTQLLSSFILLLWLSYCSVTWMCVNA